MRANWKALCKKQREEIIYLRRFVEEALSMAEYDRMVVARGRLERMIESQRSESYASERISKWVHESEEVDDFLCSGKSATIQRKVCKLCRQPHTFREGEYCSHCGAKMEGQI